MILGLLLILIVMIVILHAMHSVVVDSILAYLMVTIVGLFLIISIPLFFYESTRIKMQELEAVQNNIILNYKTLVLNMNKIAVVDHSKDKIIIDLANFKQSTNTSEVFKNWVATANEFNIFLAQEKAKRQIGFFGHLWYGWRYPINENLKFIEVKL